MRSFFLDLSLHCKHCLPLWLGRWKLRTLTIFLRWLIKDANLTIKTKTIHFLPLKDKRRNVNLVVNYTLLTNTNHKTLQRCNLFRMSTENSFKDEKKCLIGRSQSEMGLFHCCFLYNKTHRKLGQWQLMLISCIRSSGFCFKNLLFIFALWGGVNLE